MMRTCTDHVDRELTGQQNAARASPVPRRLGIQGQYMPDQPLTITTDADRASSATTVTTMYNGRVDGHKVDPWEHPPASDHGPDDRVGARLTSRCMFSSKPRLRCGSPRPSLERAADWTVDGA